MNLIWSDEAREDLHDILIYIGADNVDRAISFTIELETEAEKLCIHPMMGVQYSENLGEAVRALHYEGYTMIYEIVGNDIHIHEVYNQAKLQRRIVPFTKKSDNAKP